MATINFLSDIPGISKNKISVKCTIFNEMEMKEISLSLSDNAFHGLIKSQMACSRQGFHSWK